MSALALRRSELSPAPVYDDVMATEDSGSESLSPGARTVAGIVSAVTAGVLQLGPMLPDPIFLSRLSAQFSAATKLGWESMASARENAWTLFSEINYHSNSAEAALFDHQLDSLRSVIELPSSRYLAPRIPPLAVHKVNVNFRLVKGKGPRPLSDRD
jgi:hypothetical protein